jgi:hypothetical protein
VGLPRAVAIIPAPSRPSKGPLLAPRPRGRDNGGERKGEVTMGDVLLWLLIALLIYLVFFASG